MEAEVVNEDVKFGQHTAFAMLLPETAFISNFSMEVILFCNLTLSFLPEDGREVLRGKGERQGSRQDRV